MSDKNRKQETGTKKIIVTLIPKHGHDHGNPLSGPPAQRPTIKPPQSKKGNK